MKIRTRLGLTACILAVLAPAADAQSGHELFQQALVSKRSRADLDRAVRLYQQIADEYAEDSQLVARALVRLGGIQETLGGAGAVATYERVVQEFSGVEPEATQARARLSALRAATPTGPAAPPTRRLILDYTEDDLGESRVPGEYEVTQGGDHLLGYHEARRAFELIDIDSREIRALTRDGPDPDLDWVGGMFLSPDGDEIAATVVRPRGGARSETLRVQLRVFDVGGSGEGRLIYTWERSPYLRPQNQRPQLRPFGWSMNDARIWMWGMRTDLSAEIAWVDVTTGAFSVLKTLAWRNLTQLPSLSPDGRFIAYHDADTREGPADVFVIATDGSRELRLEHPADDSRPMFAPDGSGIVFVSDRREGTRDLWFQPLADGRASGDPRIVFRDVSPFGTAGSFSENGSLAYDFATTRLEIYTAELDVASGLVGAPIRVEPRPGEMNAGVAFSPDGRYLAHARDRGRRLVLRDVESGSEREYPLGQRLVAPSLDWCPAGPVAFVSGYQDVRVGLRVDLESGGAERLPLGNPGTVHCIGDGDEIVYVSAPAVPGEASRIVRRSLVSGAEQVLYQGPLWRNVSARSPDATQLVFLEMGADEAQLIVLSIDGGEPRSVATAPFISGFPRSRLAGYAWLPGGDALLVVRYVGAPSLEETAPEVSLSRLALDTGVETEVGRMRLPAFQGGFQGGLGLFGAVPYAVSPDGSRIAFNGYAGTIAQVWAIDGLLPYIQSGESAPPAPSIR